ncbi:hypothetical protein BC332_06766 [Capsicum chinense]|nr:hypothetical protein BC332_06766 [Capsicum chinense]
MMTISECGELILLLTHSSWDIFVLHVDLSFLFEVVSRVEDNDQAKDNDQHDYDHKSDRHSDMENVRSVRWNYSYHAVDNLPQSLVVDNMQNISNGDDSLYVDSCTTSHITNNECTLSDLKYYKGDDKIIVGNGSQLDITHVGNTIRLGMKLQNVPVVPKIVENLLSVSKITRDNSGTLEFDETDLL